MIIMTEIFHQYLKTQNNVRPATALTKKKNEKQKKPQPPQLLYAGCFQNRQMLVVLSVFDKELNF